MIKAAKRYNKTKSINTQTLNTKQTKQKYYGKKPIKWKYKSYTPKPRKKEHR